MSIERLEGFLVHAYASFQDNRVYVTGRLDDGRSFAAADTLWRPPLYIRCADSDQAMKTLRASGISAFETEGSEKVPFGSSPGDSLGTGGFPSMALRFTDYRAARCAVESLVSGGLRTYGGASRPAESLLIHRGIRGGIILEGEGRKGQRVDRVLVNPVMRAAETKPCLRVLSIDIETDETVRSIRAISLYSCWGSGKDPSVDERRVFVMAGGAPFDGEVHAVPDERSLLAAFRDAVVKLDPDVITGWNVIDFDFVRLAERYDKLRLRFDIARSDEEARVIVNASGHAQAVFCAGRQVIDAMRIARAGPQRYDGYSLETVARTTLGEGKLLGSQGPEKLDELDRLYESDPQAFARYCLRDAELAARVLFSTGLMDLTLARAGLTGTRLEAAWTSIAAFERIYDTQALTRGIVPPDHGSGAPVSGASGGQVLLPMAGLHRNVLVFDFRSLYPSLIRSFDLDPLAYELGMHETVFFPPGAVSTQDLILAPNGARFRKGSGILSGLIGSYSGEREAAQASGDETASYVYKILMNSFYGVLGAGGCKYARTELAGAVTSFGRLFLNRARAFFESSGFTVLYGDTDSVFVAVGDALPDLEIIPPAGRFTALTDFGNSLADTLNEILSAEITRDYGVRSFLKIRFEKAYTRFFLPRLRLTGASDADAGEPARGRAKGYAGFVLDERGESRVDVKGMEAVRSDVTQLARSFQLGMLALVFNNSGREAIDAYVNATVIALRSGLRDADLVYRKRLGRSAQSYVDIEPPQVKVARQLGWTNRRGTVEYLMTTKGPQALSLREAPIDYDHYIQKQLRPIAVSVADIMGWDLFRSFGGDEQLRLDF